MLFHVLFVCKCVLYYCHRVATQLQLQIYHTISYHNLIFIQPFIHLINQLHIDSFIHSSFLPSIHPWIIHCAMGSFHPKFLHMSLSPVISSVTLRLVILHLTPCIRLSLALPFFRVRPCFHCTVFCSNLFPGTLFTGPHHSNRFASVASNIQSYKTLRDFRTRLRNNQDRHGRKEHINR